MKGKMDKAYEDIKKLESSSNQIRELNIDLSIKVKVFQVQ